MIWSIPSKFPEFFHEIPLIHYSNLYCIQNCCEYNCDLYISWFGGQKVQGVYLLVHNNINLYQVVKHFVVFDGENYIDVTPFDDGRSKNVFAPIQINTHNLFFESPEYIYNIIKQETKVMYYVYCYIDPRNQTPFYVGKGKQKRAYAHMNLPRDKNKNKTRFKNKLEKMKRDGIEPIIVFLAQNIQDENIAYQIEESYIKQYGRIGYDEGGVLLNICDGARPPNHKGKTYEDIYGKENAEEQRLKRHMLQIEAGGWFRGHKHSEQTKQKFREMYSGYNSNNHFDITEEKLLEVGKDFCVYFNYEISSKKWAWWCEQKNIPKLRKTFRFNNRDIFEIFIEKFGAVKKFDSMLWFHNPQTKQTWRCLDWETHHKTPPHGYIRGRGAINKTQKC